MDDVQIFISLPMHNSNDRFTPGMRDGEMKIRGTSDVFRTFLSLGS